MKKFFTAAALFALSLVGCSCSASEPVSVEPPRNLSTSVDEFCWKYFATLNRDENIFFSPYGINAALSILANGASSDTRTEILHALAADNVEALNDEHEKFSALIERDYRGENIFMESNLLLVNKKIVGRGLDKNFQRVVANVYRSDVREADFGGDLNGVKKIISRWVNEKTKGFIPNYESIAAADTMTDLLNVVYFKGRWAIPFSGNTMRNFDFTNRDGSKTKVDMMQGVFEREISYFDDEKFCGIELLYSDNAAMYLILPRDENALDVAELWHNQSLSYRTAFLDGLRKSTPFKGKVFVRLPKFELDIENSLVENFKAMGIKRAFDNNAELFNIVNDTPLKIGDAKHRAKVKVDEQGTEASAVTEIAAVDGTAVNPRPQKTAYFYAERPFIFVIRDINSNITLFAGVVNKM